MGGKGRRSGILLGFSSFLGASLALEAPLLAGWWQVGASRACAEASTHVIRLFGLSIVFTIKNVLQLGGGLKKILIFTNKPCQNDPV